jgi:hypothetical protein
MVVGGCSCGLSTHPRLNGVLPGFPGCEINSLLDGIDTYRTFAGMFLLIKRHLAVDSVKLDDVSSRLCNWQYGKHRLPLLADSEDSVVSPFRVGKIRGVCRQREREVKWSR